MEKGGKTLYFHPQNFKNTYKSDSYLIIVSCRVQVTPSIPIFETAILK